MADDLIEWKKRLGARSHTTRELRTIEKNIQLDVSDLDRLKVRVEDIAARLLVIENRPEPLMPVAANDAIAVPKGLGDLLERVLCVETNMASQEDIDALASIIGDIGNAAMTHGGVLSKRIDALEARVSNLPSDLLAEVGRAQAELRARRP